jgi:hypothetical protein
MTMAVGFLCKDGVVIGSDRQVTSQQFTFPECKLHATRWLNGHGIVGFAGSHDSARAFLKEFYSRFWGNRIIHKNEVHALLVKCLKGASIGKTSEFQTLFGFWLDGEYQGLVTSVGNSRVLDVDECEVIGLGDSSLTRFLIGTFKDVPQSASVHQARIYAAYFISQAKKYDGKYVGGPIDVYSIDMSGQSGERCVRVLDGGRTPEWEQQTNLMRYWMDVLFSKITDNDHPVTMDQFNERLQQFREWCAPEQENVNAKYSVFSLFPPITQSTSQK